MDLLKTAKKYLNARWDKKSPLLLGYSGGGDSKALLYLLLETGVAPLHLAHVDHGWREQSADEALALADEANRLKLPFHSVRLTNQPKRNIEDDGRRQRLAFFKGLFARIPFQALLLAHHAQDAAETALKRVLEGAHLTHLNGIALESTIEGMQIWRPLLHVDKKSLLAYLEQNNLSFLSDASNEDPKFLRSRMRLQMIPELSRQFGKEVGKNLALLGERAAELRQYLDERVRHAWREDEEGIWLNFENLVRLEIRHLLQKKARFSRKLLESAVNAALEKRKNAAFEMGGRKLMIDGSCGFIANVIN